MDLSRRRRMWPTAVAVVLVVAGCASDTPESSSPAGPDASSTTTSAPGASSTTAARPTTTESGGEGACPAAESVPPAGATDVSEVSADVDGDGNDDRALAFREPGGAGRVAVELAAGGTAAVDAGGPPHGASRLSLLGGAELGGDGETLLAVIGAGASVDVVGLFQFVECAISQVTDEAGRPVELPVGGSVTHGGGLRCTAGPEGAGLTRLTATSSDGVMFSTTDTRYRVDGNTLVEIGSTSGTLDRESAGAEVDRYYTIDCPDLDDRPTG